MSASVASRRSAGWMAPATVTVVGAAITMGLGRRLWPTPPGALIPPGSVVPVFIVLEAFGCLLFGLGVAFLVFGYRLVASARQPLLLTYATYASIAWLLVSWWPHGNLHRVSVPGDWGGLVAIDLGFHLTLMLATVIVTVFFVRAVRNSASS